MTDTPLISLVLPVYNIENLMDKCFESLDKQTYPNLEIIFVDDGSSDASGIKCDQYSTTRDNVIVYHKENGGLSDARNYGVERAHGEYISFIDPDDYVDKDYIEYLYSLVCKYKTKMAICQHKVIYQSGKVINNGKNGDELIGQKRCLERMLYYDVIDTSAWAKLYRIELFSDIRYPKGKLFEDLATTYKLMLQCDDIACGYESKYNYVLRNNSISNSSFSDKKLDYTNVTDKTTAEIVSIYPDLEGAALARRVRARFSVINLMSASNTKGLKKEKKSFRYFILEHRKEVLSNPQVSRKEKIAIILISVSMRLYNFFWKHYRKGAV